jgi:hypothetical protein
MTAIKLSSTVQLQNYDSADHTLGNDIQAVAQGKNVSEWTPYDVSAWLQRISLDDLCGICFTFVCLRANNFFLTLFSFLYRR